MRTPIGNLAVAALLITGCYGGAEDDAAGGEGGQADGGADAGSVADGGDGGDGGGDGDDGGDGEGDGDGGPDDNGETHEMLSVQGIYDYVIDNDVDNVRDLLSALPESMGGSFVLMEETRSRHQASLEHPRLIMYGLDARFILSAGGVPDDPLYEVIEMAELDRETGEWIFRALDFQTDPPELGADDSSCQSCHGSPTRPIWGSYPEWPGAFGADEDNLTEAQASTLMGIKDAQQDSTRYHHLQFPGEHSIANNRTLYLPSRSYGYANTAFNFELVVAQADGLVTRMSREEGWDTLKYDLIAAKWCGEGSTQDVFGALGLDGANDFQLHRPVFEATPGDFGWNQGSTGLDDVVVFRVIDHVARTDPEMAAALAGAEPRRTEWIDHWFELRGDARAQWLLDFDLYDFDLRPQELLPAASGAMCSYLQGR